MEDIMLPELPQFTRRMTNGSQEYRNNDSSKDIRFILAVIAINVALLQVKYQNERKSPFERDFETMVAFLVVLHVYCFALFAKKKLVEAYKPYAGIIKCYVHLCGFLSNVLVVMMLVLILGRIFLGVLACCFIIVAYRLHAKINAPPANAENGDNSNRMPNSSGNADANRDGSNQVRSESTDEESNRDGTNQARNGSIDDESNGDKSAIKTREFALLLIGINA